ncbi:MAG: acetyl-CoA C-acetyltransferase [Chloroflexi bacterium]|nr:acetyl-CoA C-acetyltransferase [Chloroflexota bacterium]
MRETVIVSAVRTAMDDFGGALRDTSALELGRVVIEEAIRRAGIEKGQVDEVILGNVLPAGLGQSPARQAMLRAGLPHTTTALTVNKVCGSGLKAVMLAEYAIKAGDADIIVAGGMENMSLAPYYLLQARSGYRLGDGKVVDGMVHDGLWDLTHGAHMGRLTENVAEKWSVSRQDQDRFSLQSYQRAQQATREGRFREQIVPVPIPQRKGPPQLFDKDEVAQREASLEALAKLSPAFKEGGTITAGNASKISSGAAALVLMAAEKAREKGIRPMARVIAHGSAGIEASIFSAGPMNSIPMVLKKARLREEDIDLHEINEAFAAGALAVIKELRLDEGKVNVNGGAIALGHPIGCSGARLLVTLLYALRDRGGKRGMASLCVGGGEGVSMIVEMA